MKILFKQLSFLLIVLYVSSCTSTPTKDVNIITINTDIIKEHVDISQFVDSVTHIKLEVSENSLISNIKKIILCKNELFILSKNLLVFGTDGSFKRQIGTKGKGPGELQAVSDFVIDEKNNMVELYGFSQNKICFYSLNGIFIKELKNPIENTDGKQGQHILSFEKKPNGNYVIRQTVSRNNDNTLLDNNLLTGDFENGFIGIKPCYKFDGNITIGRHLSLSGNNCFYLGFLNDTIYKVGENNELSVECFLDFGKDAAPNYIKQADFEDQIQMINGNVELAFIPSKYFKCSKFTHFNFNFHGSLNTAIIEDGNILIGRKVICNKVIYRDIQYFNGDNVLFSVCGSKYLDSTLTDCFNNDVDINDNPYVTMFTLK